MTQLCSCIILVVTVVTDSNEDQHLVKKYCTKTFKTKRKLRQKQQKLFNLSARSYDVM